MIVQIVSVLILVTRVAAQGKFNVSPKLNKSTLFPNTFYLIDFNDIFYYKTRKIPMPALCLKRETLIGLRLTQSDYGNYLYQIFMRNISILNIYNNFL